jgi:beta-glucosidase
MKKSFALLVLILVVLSACQPAVETVVEAPPEVETILEETPQDVEQVQPTVEILEPAYLNSDLPAEERAADLLSRMSLAEKIGQMTLIEKGSITPDAVYQYFIGGVLSGGGGTPRENTPEGWAEMVDAYQEAAMDTPLGIPIIYGVDAVHGHSNLKGAVIFPHNIGLGAARDPELVREIARVTALEMAATNIYWNYAPVLAVGQDIRWGRTYEVFSEDTDLVTALSVAYLEGLQGADLSDPLTALGTPKHYVGDGGTLWGTSLRPGWEIDQGDLQVDEATLRAIHLAPYAANIEAGALSIMASYSSWNGLKTHADQYLLTEVLKNELGFEGFVVSDWQAINQIGPNFYESVVTAINAGIDMNMVPYSYQLFIDTMTMAVEKGDIPQERVDDAVRRILTVKFQMGLFERPFSDPALLDLVGAQAHRDLAREAVAKSLVLLQDDDDILPLSVDTPLIFLAGEGADDIGLQCGGWTITWQGSKGAITPGTTLTEAFEAASTGTIQYNRFGRYENILDENGNPVIADVGIVVIGEDPYAEGEGDTDDLTLSQIELDLIARVKEQSERVVVLIMAGRPLVITEALDLADAWVAIWLPGTEGDGVADVIFGNAPFVGKTPFTWPASMDQLPLGSYTTQPLFPYGHGIEK